jgi:hypothetical protein
MSRRPSDRSRAHGRRRRRTVRSWQTVALTAVRDQLDGADPHTVAADLLAARARAFQGVTEETVTDTMVTFTRRTQDGTLLDDVVVRREDRGWLIARDSVALTTGECGRLKDPPIGEPR